MPTLTEDQAKDIVRAVLTDIWASEHQPAVGARVKAIVMRMAAERGAEFNERALGYSGFTDFLSKTGVAAVRFRPGTDALVAPPDHAEALHLEAPVQRERIRADFWDAFVSFPVPGEVRGYDPAADGIVRSNAALAEGTKPITPITRETQVRWREEFIDSLEDDSPLRELKGQFTAPGGLSLFTKALTATPSLRPRWNDFLVGRVRTVIEEWGARHGIAEVWLARRGEPRSTEPAVRARLYALLDQIPIERLLELRVPLGWLIRKDG